VAPEAPAFDSLGNVFQLAQFIGASNGAGIPGGDFLMCICYANITVAGTPTVTMQFVADDGNPLFDNVVEGCFFVAEVSSLPVTATVSSGAAQQTGTGAASVTLTDNFSASITTAMGTGTAVSASVACLQVLYAHETFVALAGGYSSAPSPTLTGGSYTLIDSETSPGGFKAYWFLSGTTPPIAVQAQIFVIT
jgi:hypothetical protein